MLKKFSFLLLLFFIGWGNNNQSCNGYLKFKPILEKAKLQCPTSEYNSTYSRHYGDFEGFSSKYFYYKDCDLNFYMCGEHNRSELRFKNEFYISDEENKTLEAIVKLIPNTDEFTFLQIHGVTNGLNKPVLRVALYKGDIKFFIFDGDKYIIKNIGDYKGGFLDFKIIAGNEKLYIYKNNNLEFNTTINYPDKCYYKLGVYLQRDGCARAEFKKIKINF